MDRQNRETEAPSPRKLLAAFTGGHIFFWVVAAMLIHAVVIGGLSMTYIRDRWIDPEGAKIRKAAAEEAKKDNERLEEAKRKREQARLAKTNQPPEGASSTNAVSGSATNATSVTVEGAGELPADRIGAPVVRRITEKAATNEIPADAAPGLSIDETIKH